MQQYSLHTEWPAYMDIHQNIIIGIALIGILSLFSQWLAWYIKLPAILILLLCGIIFGPELGLGLIRPDDLFGQLLFPIISISVAIILFEGSLYLRFSNIQGLGKVVTNLASVGLICTICGTWLLAHILFKLSWPLAALLATVISVGGPTVVAPILRTVRPERNIKQILHWESILIDPIGALACLLMFNIFTSSIGKTGHWQIAEHFIQVIMLGLAMGIGAGMALAEILKKQWLPEYLYNIATLTLVIATFSLANMLTDGAGLLAVTLMGIYLANIDEIHIEDIINFKENLSILFISGLFIILAARVPFTHWENYLLNSFLLYLAIQLVIRPISVYIATLGSGLNWREKILISWICPRGIVAAAIAAIFTIKLNAIGIKQAEPFMLMTFLIIMFSVVIQSATSRKIACWLKVAEPKPNGFLIVGANPVARTIALALKENEINILLIDTHWDNISQSRMDNLECHYGYVLTEDPEQNLDISGLNALIALTPHHEFNKLACLHLQSEFGRHGVYYLSSSVQKKGVLSNKEKNKEQLDELFQPTVSYSKIASMLRQDATITTTMLTEQFTLEKYIEQEEQAILLFYIDVKNQIKPLTKKTQITTPSEGKIIALKPK